LKEDHTKDYPSLFDFFIRLDMVSDEKIFKWVFTFGGSKSAEFAYCRFKKLANDSKDIWVL
jgi:hypothetical protein